MKVDAAVDKADDVLGAVRDQKGTVGKLIYDPSAYDSVKGVADKGNALLGDVREGKGTLGKLVTDDTLFTNLRDASANVRETEFHSGHDGKILHRSRLLRQCDGANGRSSFIGRRI